MSAILCPHRLWIAAGAALLFSPLASSAQDKEKPADIPIKRVVMFSSGVAFFEHGGQVEGNAQVDLQFNVKDINDLLKSMVLQDEGGGKISTVSYGSKDPVTRTLSTFSVNLTANPTLADLLNQIRGEQIEVDAPTKVSGMIVGVETREVPVGKDQQVVKQSYLNLLTEEGLRSVSLEGVGRLKLANAKLDAELRQALAVLAASKSMDKKTVSLSFLGQGKRDVRVGYIQEAPIWKTSYRLVLDKDEKPLLQGWAIVENTTESDWNDVNLTLISGRPISFVMDLYEPLYLARPEVRLELYASLRPRTYDQDLGAADAEFKKAAEQLEKARETEGLARNRQMDRARAGAGAGAMPPGAPTGGGLGGRGFLADAKGEARDGANYRTSIESVAQAADVGEMFRYQIAAPVKLGRSKSAMLPIVNESVTAEKVAIYNEGTHAKHPLSGLKLKNSTDLHLMQGPITVFAEGAYAGDAQIQDLPPGTERLISYAMDLDTEVAPLAKDSPDRLVSVKISKGLLLTSHKFERSRTYTVKNSSKEDKNVLVEYPLDPAWALVAPKEPAEKTRNMYRFAVKAEPGKPATLEVKEERTTSQQVAINNLDDGTILIYVNAPTVSEEVKKALREVIQRKTVIQGVVTRRQELERQIVVIDQEQKRIRDNMAQLPKDSDLFRRYVTKFTEQEDKIDDLRKQVSASVEEEQKLRKSLDEFLLAMEIA
jgi:hypothetical protein